MGASLWGPPLGWGNRARSAPQRSEAGTCRPHQLGLKQALWSVGSEGGDEVIPRIQASTCLHSRAG